MPTVIDESIDAQKRDTVGCEHAGLGLAHVDKKRVAAGLFEDDDPQLATLGRFRILGRLGGGGMGTVHEAYDPQLDRKVALKVLHGAAGAGSRHTQRLLREAQALARLSHPNVVSVFEAGELEGRLFIAMELVVGEPLCRWNRRPHSWRACLDVFGQAGRGLAAAHRVGIVHRDFKPANCILDEAGQVRVLDFGLARGVDDDPTVQSGVSRRRSTDESGDDGTHPSGRALEHRLTMTGTMMGTPAYMAPEQAQECRADHRADQFSFCVALYEALYGQRPHAGIEGLFELIEGKTPPYTSTPQHKGLPRVPRWLRAVLARGLEPDPDARFPDMDSLLQAIDRPLQWRRRAALGALAGTGVAATVGLTLAVAPADPTTPDCNFDDAAMAGVWDATTQSAIRRAFDTSDLPLAAATHQTVQSALERWSEQWLQTRMDACRATHVDGVASEALLDLRIDCLDRQRDEVVALVTALAQADHNTITHAPDRVAVLPDAPAACKHPHVAQEQRPPAAPDPIARVCTHNGECLADAFCDFDQAAACGDVAGGTCRPRPAGCDAATGGAVCGCDGNTYPSACDAARSGVALADERAGCSVPTIYDAAADFQAGRGAGAQGHKGWYYLYDADGTSKYTEHSIGYTFWREPGAWRDEKCTESAFIQNGPTDPLVMVPPSVGGCEGFTTLAWEAPEDGPVEIELDTQLNRTDCSSQGVELEFRDPAGTVLWAQDAEQGVLYEHAAKLTMRAGERVYLRAWHGRGGSWCDSVYVNVVVKQLAR